MKKNDIITLEITDISVDGFGIGRYENIAVFVPFAAVGDTLQVLIVKVLKSYCLFILIKLYINRFVQKSHHLFNIILFLNTILLLFREKCKYIKYG